MIDGKKILEAIRERWQSGETQTSIAKAAGISHAHVCELISGKADIEGITIKTINKLFPDATLNLGGARHIGNGNTILNSRVQSDDVFLTDKDQVKNFKNTLLEVIIGSNELSDEERGRVLRIVNGVKHE